MMIECVDGVNEHLIYTCSVLRSESSTLLPFSGLSQEYNFSVVPSLPWELFFGKQIKELLLVVNVDGKKTCKSFMNGITEELRYTLLFI